MNILLILEVSVDLGFIFSCAVMHISPVEGVLRIRNFILNKIKK